MTPFLGRSNRGWSAFSIDCFVFSDVNDVVLLPDIVGSNDKLRHPKQRVVLFFSAVLGSGTFPGYDVILF